MAKPRKGGIGGIALVYGAGFLQGLALVSFPASATVFKQTLGFSDAQYGLIFLPQVALALIGALGGAFLAQRFGLRALLVAAFIGNALSQLFLAASVGLAPMWQVAAVLCGTAALGLGFGLSGAPLNSYPALFFPRHSHSAVVGLHTLVGLGLAAGPLLVGMLVEARLWSTFPLTLFGLCLGLAVAALAIPLPPVTEPSGSRGRKAKEPTASPAFWGFVAVAVLYAFAEGTFSNWAIIYLTESKGLPPATGTVALASFWAALVAGRLLVSGLVMRVSPVAIWITLPGLMLAAFLLLPFADSAPSGIVLFALAGLGCSAFFPLTITLAAQSFPARIAWVSSMMIAALMLGVGVGSYVIGPLRALLPLERLYQLSALYPALVLLIAAALLPRYRRASSAA